MLMLNGGGGGGGGPPGGGSSCLVKIKLWLTDEATGAPDCPLLLHLQGRREALRALACGSTSACG